MESFIDPFFKRSSPCTLRTKATCLKRACDVGVVFGKDDSVRNRLTLVSVILRNIANGARRAHRASCQRKKLLTPRGQPNMHVPLNPSCAKFLKRRAKKYLDCMMRTHLANRGKSSSSITKPIAHSKMKLWIMNFVGLLMLTSGGQRPQVFSQLQVPSRR